METPEDLMITKLTYGSPQDIEDVQAILAKQKGKLDMKYLSEQARKMNVEGALTKILKG